MKYLKTIYFRIFANSIALISKSKYFNEFPILGSLFLVSNGMFFNLMLIWLIIQTHLSKGFTDFVVIEIISNSKYNIFLHFFLLMYFPIFLFNYFMIAYKNKYIEISECFPDEEFSNLTLIYYLFSVFSLVLYFVIVVI
jgi:hypothetical protein